MNEAKRPKNWLLIKIRQWHSWLGVALSLFILLVCGTGIYLNHKDLFSGKKEEPKPAAAGGMGKAPAEKEPRLSGMLTTGTALASLPVSFDAALARSREHLGDAAIEKIELKDEKGTLVYKIKAGEEREVTVNAQTGTSTLKEKYRKTEMAGGKGVDGGASAKKGYDWGKIIKDLHTGKLGGEAGKLFVDATAIVISLLTLSGLYLWAVPKLRKRKAAQQAVSGVNGRMARERELEASHN